MNKDENIFVVGNLGSGKTTFIKSWQAKYKNGIVVDEKFSENPFLASFYKDMSRWGFPMQVKFLIDYLNSYRKQKKDVVGITYLIDAGVWTNWHVFTKQLSDKKLISSEEFILYEDLTNQLVGLYEYPQPDKIVYVDTSPQECLRHIKSRGFRLSTINNT